MSHSLKVFFVFTLLFLAVVEAKHKKKHKHKIRHGPKPFLPLIPPFGSDELPPVPQLPPIFEPPSNIPQLPPFPLKQDGEEGQGVENTQQDAKEGIENKLFEVTSIGHWEIISENAGVSAMHINLLPTNKIIVYDAKVYRTSRIKLPDGVPCVPYRDMGGQEDKLDCFAHAVEYDIETNQVRPLQITAGDPWCSSGGVAPDGTFVSAGGFDTGARSVRYMGPNCQNCEWREYDNIFGADRWYATQQILPNGEFILVGGRRSFSYEFIPVEGQRGEKPYFFPFLYETSDIDENNLYPFVHLSTDGNLFIFSNNRSLLLNPTTHKIVRTFPVLPGGSRNYPASGMLTISEPFPEWESELMPSGRTMGDLLVLPNGDLLLINGATMGTAAWWDADLPNYTPVLYKPEDPKGLRFTVLKPSQIARMYHSTSTVLPSGKIWVSGSNTHNTYRDVDKFPTETRVEAFSPPYLDANFDKYRPQIDEDASEKELAYGGLFEASFSVEDGAELTKNNIKVSMYSPPFTTHGFSMGQRLLFLKIDELNVQGQEGSYRVRVEAPPSNAIAPPGYYLLFVVYRGLPAAKGMWVHIQ
ncbi:Galactose oxidase [Glycine soja]|nr:Galactose oxidase [Glycine soja]